MSQFLPVSWPLALSALVALQASAQVNVSPPTPAPKTPTAPASLAYRSVFDGYQPFTDEKVAPWKDSNSTVEKIGGWRAYAKEAAEPTPSEESTPAATPAAPASRAAAPNPHAGHGKH